MVGKSVVNSLYNHTKMKEHILSLSAVAKSASLDDMIAVNKDKLQLKVEKRCCARTS